jgi:hypothetical protein
MAPPSVPFVFAVGVTGHRKNALAPSALLTVHERIRTVLESLAHHAAVIHTTEQQYFSPDPPRLLFVSALADGADQMAAEVALDLGFELHAVLPFDSGRYRAGMPDDASRTRFDTLSQGQPACSSFRVTAERISRLMSWPAEPRSRTAM